MGTSHERPGPAPLSGADVAHPDAEDLVAFAHRSGPVADEDALVTHLADCQRCRQMVAAIVAEKTEVSDAPAAEQANGASDDPLVGKFLGEYFVLKRISAGGMGAVYRAVQPELNKLVAIKTLLPHVISSAEHRHRLLAEARAANAIHHPNIVNVFGFGKLPDRGDYIVMELLRGAPLSSILHTRGRLPEAEALQLVEQVASALSAVHSVGVVHRDLKPGNLFISRAGDTLHVTVLDFGIAKGLRAPLANVATLPNAVLGTPGYMAPELIRGEAVGPKADVYSLGCVLFKALSGQDVFQADNDLDLMRKHLTEPVPKLGSRRVTVHEAVEQLTAAMLAKTEVARPSANEVRDLAAEALATLQDAATYIGASTEERSAGATTLPPSLPPTSARGGPRPDAGATTAPSGPPTDPSAPPTLETVNRPPGWLRAAYFAVVALAVVLVGVAVVRLLHARFTKATPSFQPESNVPTTPVDDAAGTQASGAPAAPLAQGESHGVQSPAAVSPGSAPATGPGAAKTKPKPKSRSSRDARAREALRAQVTAELKQVRNGSDSVAKPTAVSKLEALLAAFDSDLPTESLASEYRRLAAHPAGARAPLPKEAAEPIRK